MENQSSILITGGGGMLAQAFRRLLPNATFATHAEFDIANPESIVWLEQLRPAVVINCAAYTKVDQAELERKQALDSNGSGVASLVTACCRIGAALVHFSTDYVFEGTLRRPLLPDDPAGPQSVYGLSKLLGESAIRENPPRRWLIIRTAWLFGPGGPNFPNTMIAAARAGKPLTVIDDQVGSPTYTNDLAAATLELLRSDAQGIFHVCNSGQTTWHELAVETLRYMNVPVQVAHTTSDVWKAARPASAIRPHYSVLDTSAYTAATEKTMRSWKDALHDYLDHHQQRTI